MGRHVAAPDSATRWGILLAVCGVALGFLAGLGIWWAIPALGGSPEGVNLGQNPTSQAVTGN